MRWSDEENALLIREYSLGDWREIAILLPARSWVAIRLHAQKLGIKRQKEVLPWGFKRCTKCDRVKLLEEFSKDRSRGDGLASWCRMCRSEYNAEYNTRHRERRQQVERRRYVENSDKIKARVQEYKQNNPDKVAEHHRRRRARKAGAEGSHTRAQFEAVCEKYGWICLCCGMSHSESPLTEDHIVPLSRGGSDGISNIQPLCLFCNDMKGIRAIDYRGGEQCG